MLLKRDPNAYQELMRQRELCPRLLQTQAPGRMNLIGEHTDYNGGKVLPFAINSHITLTCLEPHPSVEKHHAGQQFLFTSAHTEELFTIDLKELAALWDPAAGTKEPDSFIPVLTQEIQKSWAAYACGALYHLVHTLQQQKLAPSRKKYWIHVDSDLPVGAGISSSAALTTGLLTTLWFLHQIPCDREDIARKAMLIEHKFIGTMCGLMDQLAVLFAKKEHFLLIDFLDFARGGEILHQNILIHPKLFDYQIIGLNTGVKHTLSDSPYNERRAACEAMAKALNTYFGVDFHSLGEYSRCLPPNPLYRALHHQFHQSVIRRFLAEKIVTGPDGDRVAGFAAHAICENARVDRAISAIQTGHLAILDEALLESHQSLKDDYQVSCDELDLIQTKARETAFGLASSHQLEALPIIGPRMMGGGFGGSTIQLVHKKIVDDFLSYFANPTNAYTAHTGIEVKSLVTGAENGLITQRQE
jgi:galactokinase